MGTEIELLFGLRIIEFTYLCVYRQTESRYRVHIARDKYSRTHESRTVAELFLSARKMGAGMRTKHSCSVPSILSHFRDKNYIAVFVLAGRIRS